MRKRYVARLVLLFAVVGAVLASWVITTHARAAIEPATVVGAWLLDEGQGKDAKDISENERDGKLTGARWVAGKLGKALAFNGKDEFVEVPDGEGLDAIPQITVVAWVEFDNWPKQHYAPVGKEPVYRLIVAPGGAGHFVVATTANGWYSAGTVAQGGGLQTGQWHHLAGTYDGTRVLFYIDGQVAGEGPQDIVGDIVDNAAPFYMAKTTANNVDFFEGVVDEVAIFNVALSETEIQSIMDRGLTKVLAGDLPVSVRPPLSVVWAGLKTPSR